MLSRCYHDGIVLPYVSANWGGEVCVGIGWADPTSKPCDMHHDKALSVPPKRYQSAIMALPQSLSRRGEGPWPHGSVLIAP